MLSAFLIQSWQRAIFQNDVITNIITVCSVAELLTWVSGRLQFRPASSVVSGHFIRDPKNNPYISSSVTREELLNSSRSFRVELPHTERSTLAWQDPTNQHYLYYFDEADIPLKEISDAALQCQHVIHWPPVQPFVDP